MDGFREPHTPQAVQEQQDRTGLSWVLQPQAASSLGELQGCPGSTPGPACGFPGKSTALACQALPPYLPNQSKITKSLSFPTGCPAQLSSLSLLHLLLCARTAPRCCSEAFFPLPWSFTPLLWPNAGDPRAHVLHTSSNSPGTCTCADEDDVHPAQHDAARLLQCCSRLHTHEVRSL